MAEWSALQTGIREGSSSIPAEVKTFLKELRVSDNALIVVLN